MPARPLHAHSRLALVAALGLATGRLGAAAVEAPATATAATPAPAGAPAARLLYIREIRVTGAHALPPVEVQDTVYPFLGPGRTADDVEQARAALEKAYQAKGYQGASVQVPAQTGRGGIIVLQVSEGVVGRLRVHGSRYFLPSAIKEQARSLAEGKVVNFNDVTREVLALNQLPDRQITPALRAGEEPGTVDIDLNVKDKLPLHGSVELNNRYNANTTPLRLTISANYNNLWQLGHTLGGSYSVAPEKRQESEIISGYYIARFAGAEGFSLMLQGRKQSSSIGIVVTGGGEVSPGESYGIRAIFTLPPRPNFFHSATIGLDYNHFGQTGFDAQGNLDLNLVAPITDLPLSFSYSATWSAPPEAAKAGRGYTTDLNLATTLAFRGVGSSNRDFDTSRFGATGSFIKVRGDLSHTRDLPGHAELYGKVEGQIADSPLINSEQISAGGIGSVRGYLEAEALADNGILGTLELRSPSLLGFLGKDDDEWRLYAFTAAAYLTLRETLPEQQSKFTLASAGVGSRLKLLGHLNGSVDFGVPFTSQSTTKAREPRLTFRAWMDF